MTSSAYFLYKKGKYEEIKIWTYIIKPAIIFSPPPPNLFYSPCHHQKIKEKVCYYYFLRAHPDWLAVFMYFFFRERGSSAGGLLPWKKRFILVSKLGFTYFFVKMVGFIILFFFTLRSYMSKDERSRSRCAVLANPNFECISNSFSFLS